MRSTLSRVGPRRGSGEASASRSQSVDIETEITALAKWEIQELRAEWRKLYRAEPPRRLSRDLILRAIAYRIQERTHGGLGLAIKRRLNALAEELEAKGAAHFDAATVLKPGTKLVREWHGRTHTVMVAEDGFEFDRQRYRSLTRVATLITGVHWSGPVFFGLRKRRRVASERGHE
jgi:hypothetical protein